MKRLSIVVLNLILIIAGFFIIYFAPWSAVAIILGMLSISIAIISFAFLIYFPPPKPGYVHLKVVEANEKPRRMSLKAKKTRKVKKKSKRSRKK